MLFGYARRASGVKSEPTTAYTEQPRLAAVVQAPLIPPTEAPTPAPKYTKQPSSGSGVYCSCIQFLEASGIWLPPGLNRRAGELPVKYKQPQTSGVVITYESWAGHAAYYERDGDWLVLNEANYTPCQQTKGRRLHKDDPVIKGFI